MKTTMIFRKTANPKRTTLAHLADATHLVVAEAVEHPLALPASTANPKRTRLMTAPIPHQAAEAQDTPGE
ncbi:hypothetical protein [Streptomyces fuscigenes]|uniref:hypothetical protein n=1 Tax=Streptomyces fuscigenes TaxID=1528880 RepID=UPI001F2E0DBA|nr:hypothetical protein [Streptomyces fuscigenes]MCF3964393.1 hypothetical protein [Streptomyces fuscigenes]